MKHFLIYTNRNKDSRLEMTGRVRKFLEYMGQRVSVLLRTAEEDMSGEDWDEDVDCLIVLGGDGTVLQAVRECGNRQIPLIGVNLGTLGYMTEVEPDSLEESLFHLVAGDYELESRMMLSGTILSGAKNSAGSSGAKNGKTALRAKDGEEDWALNDIVIARRGPLQIIRYNLYVNGQFLNAYHADGMIVTTPTGSTGYNLSAGGPIVEPGARLIVLTPVCPHTLSHRSIIFSPEDVIEIEITYDKEGQKQSVDAYFDGNHPRKLRTGDRIRIAQSGKEAEFIRLNQVSFLEVLHRKMGDSQSPG